MQTKLVQIVSIRPGIVAQGARFEFLSVVTFGNDSHFVGLKVGGEGRGSSHRYIPLTNCQVNVAERIDLRKVQVKAVRLRQGRSGWIGEAVEDIVSADGALVLLDLAGGFRGFTGLPALFGNVQTIEVGWCAQGAAGRAGRHPQLMLLATGPARVEWHRSGRLYGDPADWVAWSEDGWNWHVQAKDIYGLACDAGLVPAAVQELEPVPQAGQA